MNRIKSKVLDFGLTLKLHILAYAYIGFCRLNNFMAKQGLMLGANTLTNLIPSLYEALDVVSRELTGAIPCATLDAQVSQAAVGQVVTSFVTPSAQATDITPGVTPPNDGDQNIGNVQLTITKARRVPFRWNGEEERGLDNNGGGSRPIKNAQLQQAIRTLVNEMEGDVVKAARVAASRAYGTAGTTPFASSLADPAQVRKILDDNGAPPSDRCVVIDTTAGAAMRTLGQLTKANEAGTTMTMRDGELLNIHGMSFHESAAVQAIVPGTGAGYLVNAPGGLTAGTTIIPVDTGTGTILAGDVVVFNGDTNKYVVITALSGGQIEIGGPGLRKALADNATVTVSGAFTPNVAFSQSSLILATRAPALPEGGDMAIDRTLIQDPRTGITFEVAMYAQYRQMQYEISAVWGVKGIKPAHCALLLG